MALCNVWQYDLINSVDLINTINIVLLSLNGNIKHIIYTIITATNSSV